MLLLEDDALPQNDMLHVLHSLLTVIHEHQQQWSLMKLYYPQKWQGYAFDVITVIELLSVGILFGSSFYAIQFKCSKHPVLRTNKNMRYASFLMGFCYGVLCCLAIGRCHLIELKRLMPSTYSLRHAPDCCSPGILYPVDVATQLIDMLNKTKCHPNNPLDMAVAAFTQNIGYRTYIVEPNLVKHIGMVSTIKGVSTSPWDFLL